MASDSAWDLAVRQLCEWFSDQHFPANSSHRYAENQVITQGSIASAVEAQLLGSGDSGSPEYDPDPSILASEAYSPTPGPPPTPDRETWEERQEVPAAESRAKKRLKRSHRRLHHQHAPQQGQSHNSSFGFDLAYAPMSSTGWSGTRRSAALVQQIMRDMTAGRYRSLFGGFKLIHFPEGPGNQGATFIRDCKGRLIIWRSGPSLYCNNLLAPIHEVVSNFVSSCVNSGAFSPSGHARGSHFSCNLGHHRESSQEPILSAWHRKNLALVDPLLASGGLIQSLSAWGCKALAQQFPKISQRYQDCIDYHRTKHGIQPHFGLFWSFALNVALPEKGVYRVETLPHIDSKNLAVGVCMIFVYCGNRPFNHREYCWLVAWEAQVIIQVPPGVFVLLPSSLFHHFNVDVAAFDWVTTANGAVPTRENTQPLADHTGDGSGRGSMVWYNQSTMFQASEMDVATLGSLRRVTGASTPTAYPAVLRINQGFFPAPD